MGKVLHLGGEVDGFVINYKKASHLHVSPKRVTSRLFTLPFLSLCRDVSLEVPVRLHR